MLKPGHIVDRYKVESVIGTGGTAVVYRVRHESLGTAHALKVLSVTSDVIRDRMLQEGRVQASLRHPNIVAVTDVLNVDGSPGLLMEYIEGPSLQKALKEFKLPLEAAEMLFLGVVAGVAEAHGEGLVHRDLKPANVLLAKTAEGFVPKVTDFGLAKVLVEAEDAGHGHTRSGVAMGTPAYMAIEQIRDAKTVDQRADVFSLGCMLYELVCGQRAFPGEDAITIYNAIMQGQYLPPQQLVPSLPDRIDNAIRGALEQDKEVRIPSCEVLLEVLRGEQVWLVAEDPDITEDDPPTIETARPANPDAPEMIIALAPPKADPANERSDLPKNALEAALGNLDDLDTDVGAGEDPLYATIGAAGAHISPYNFMDTDVREALAADASPFIPEEAPEPDPEEVAADTGGSYTWVAIALLVFLLAGLGAGGFMLSLALNNDAGPTAPVVTPPTVGSDLGSALSAGTEGTGTEVPIAPAHDGSTQGTPAETSATEGTPKPHTPPVKTPGTGTTPSGAGTTVKSTPPKSVPTVTPEPSDPEPIGSSPRMDMPPPTTSSPPAQVLPVTVKLLSKPPTATVYVDGKDVGRTPSKIELKPGTHRVKVESGGEVGEFTVKVVQSTENKWCWDFAKGTSHKGSCPR